MLFHPRLKLIWAEQKEISMTAADCKLFWSHQDCERRFILILYIYIYIYMMNFIFTCCDTSLFDLWSQILAKGRAQTVGFNLLLPLFVASSERANEPHAKKKWKHKLNLKQLVFATFRVLSSVSRKPVLVTCLKFMSFFICLSFRCWCSPWPQLGTSWFYVPCYFG